MTSVSFKLGQRVVLHGMATVALNGRRGTVARRIPDTDRYAVLLDGDADVISILESKLKDRGVPAEGDVDDTTITFVVAFTPEQPTPQQLSQMLQFTFPSGVTRMDEPSTLQIYTKLMPLVFRVDPQLGPRVCNLLGLRVHMGSIWGTVCRFENEIQCCAVLFDGEAALRFIAPADLTSLPSFDDAVPADPNRRTVTPQTPPKRCMLP